MMSTAGLCPSFGSMNLAVPYFSDIPKSMKVGQRGQITLPIALRKRHGIKPFSEVEVVEEGHRLILRKKGKPSAFRNFSGVLKAKSQRTDEVIAELRGQ